MKRLLIVAAVVLAASVGAASGDTFVVVPNVSLPSAGAENPTGASLPEALALAPATPQELPFQELRRLWQGAGATYGVPWEVLAAINKVESDFGRNMGPSSAGAIGWMQFMPSTWLSWGTDADGDGVANPWTPADAVYAAARYLAAAGAAHDLHGAIFSYNHAEWYVQEVLDLASVYDRGGSDGLAALDGLQQTLTDDERAVSDANSQLDDAVARVAELDQAREQAVADGIGSGLLSDQLDAQQRAAQLGADREEAQAQVDALRATLDDARSALAGARDRSQGAAFDPNSSSLLGAPSFNGDWVFPVGGGPSLVSVSRAHHDYPAADIAAPAGTPVYALGNAIVLRAWALPQGSCGIGATLQTKDGRAWTYCHLSYLDAGVTVGAALAAGAHVGLVGQTGDATGPHLHLQLQPAASYPQDESWFGAFAGKAFRWQDVAGEPRAGSTFAVAGVSGT